MKKQQLLAGDEKGERESARTRHSKQAVLRGLTPPRAARVVRKNHFLLRGLTPPRDARAARRDPTPCPGVCCSFAARTDASSRVQRLIAPFHGCDHAARSDASMYILLFICLRQRSVNSAHVVCGAMTFSRRLLLVFNSICICRLRYGRVRARKKEVLSIPYHRRIPEVYCFKNSKKKLPRKRKLEN